MRARVRALTKGSTLAAHGQHVVLNVIATVQGHLEDTVSKLQMYPPPKAGSSYIRTRRLADNWRVGQVTFSGSGIRGTISNESRYTGFVHGDEQGIGQQVQHKVTGWPLMAEVLRAGFNEKIQRAVKEAD